MRHRLTERKIVVCVDNKGAESLLTIGKEYTILQYYSDEKSLVKVKTDDNSYKYLVKSRFKSKEDYIYKEEVW